jgi:5-methyltetrahydropteroyltriglutamate--homocysteine methyltransferase
MASSPNTSERDIPPERIRLYLGWGNYEGPHHRDISLKDIFGVVLNARAQAISLEGVNPRHEHEWAVFQAVRLPDDNILTTGVLDSTTNFIEHPELVAQRLVRYAEVVGKENVIAGSDCGFATCARTTFQVEPEIV